MAQVESDFEKTIDPYAVLFPLGVLSGLLGVALWVFFQFRWIPFFPRAAHANLMIFGLFWSFISGFLMTAVPRMTKTQSARIVEWLLAATLVIFQWIFAVRNMTELGFWLALVQWMALFNFLVTRFFRRQQTPFAGFVFLPFAFVCFLIGLALQISSPTSDSSKVYFFLTQAFLLNLICGLGSRLIPMISRIPQTTAIDQAGASSAWRKMFVLASALNLTFLAEVWGFTRAAALARTLVLLFLAVRHFQIWSPAPEVTYLGLGLRVSVWFMILGTGLAAVPEISTLASQHLLFIGGFGMVTLMVATRVTWAHAGQSLAQEGQLKTPIIVMLCLIFGSILRLWVQADLASSLVTASACFFALALAIWAARFGKLWFKAQFWFGLGLLFTLGHGHHAEAKVVHYDLHIRQEPVNLSGRSEVNFALSINGQIPAPTLEFTEGDEAEIVVHNELANQEASIHWHGVLLPNDMDGVPYLNTPPIPAKSQLTFRFPIRQSGTYWYHSHTGLQEQKGLFGALVFQPRTKNLNLPKFDRELVLVLSDWTDENPDQVLKNLRKSGDYFSYKKKSVRSWWGAFQAGRLWTQLMNEWDRMPGMDLSDVGYDAFLVNGKRTLSFDKIREGERVRIRLINAGSSTYFRIRLGDQTMKVISADGLDVQPTIANEILMGMAETYDLSWVQPRGRHELLAMSQDLSGSAQVWLGSGDEHPAARPAPVDLYAPMNHGGTHSGMDHTQMGHAEHSNHAEHSEHDEHDDPSEKAAVEQLTVDDLASLKPTEIQATKRVLEMKLVLGGDMDRYVWHFNGKTIAEDRTIEIQTGDIIRFQLINETMMHHPIHLHGHFFRVLTSSGANSPLKHTVDVPPHGQRTIEFKADEPGTWMIHCHNLYHMKTGMARVIQYSDFKPRADILKWQDQDPHQHEHLYTFTSLSLASNLQQAFFRLSRTWDQLELRFENREWENFKTAEGDFFYRRWLSNYSSLVGGYGHFEEYSEHPDFAQVGAAYRLPFMIDTQTTVDHRGRFRLQLGRRIQWTTNWYSELEWNLRQKARGEFATSLLYGPSFSWALGLFLTEEKAGLGFKAQF